jgi:peptidoglycan/LPS O-acetylase OafA/YrhL
VWGGIGVSGIVFYCWDLFGPAYTRETFIGLFMGVPLVTFLGKSSVRLPYNALLGALSYGVFLGHFPVKWWLDYTGWIGADSMMYIPAIMLGSLLLAYGGVQGLEKRVDAVRKRKK